MFVTQIFTDSALLANVDLYTVHKPSFHHNLGKYGICSHLFLYAGSNTGSLTLVF